MYKNKEKELMNHLRNNIRKLRNERNLTQENISECVGFGREYIAKIETGRRNVTLKLLLRISIYLNIPLKEIFDFEIE